MLDTRITSLTEATSHLSPRPAGPEAIEAARSSESLSMTASHLDEPMNDSVASKYVSGHYDYILLGGSLENCLLALALRQHKPEARIALVEREARLLSERIWPFHAYDVPDDCQHWFAPLVQWQWSGYDVFFADYQRHVRKSYGAFSAERLERTVRTAFDSAPYCDLYTATEVIHYNADRCIVENGRPLSGLVIDSCMPHEIDADECGHQHTLAVEVELTRPHGLSHPVLMDARVEQEHGCHSISALPLDERRVLIQDVLLADRPGLDRQRAWHDIQTWLRERNWQIERISSEWEELSPLPWRSLPDDSAERISNGYGGGWFNPATGHCLPSAIRFADFLAQQPLVSLHSQLADLRDRHVRQSTFYHVLARLMFKATPAHQRHRLMARLYRMPEDCITRFYAMEMTPLDKLRCLLGTTPQGVSLPTAFSALASWIGGRYTRS